MEDKVQLLIVDDDTDLASNLQDILEEAGYSVQVAPDGRSALKICSTHNCNLALIDIKLPDITGVELVKKLTEINPATEYIIITGYATIDNAIAAVGQKKIIAFETKPLQIEAFLSFIRQVIERQEAERKARLSKSRYRLLAENIVDVIWTVGLDFHPTYVSPSVTQLLGYSIEEAMAQTVERVLTPTSLKLVQQAVSEDLSKMVPPNQSGKPSLSRTLELELIRRDGSTLWTESKVSYLFNGRGEPDGIMGVTRDITERKRVDEVLRRSEARLAEAQKIAHVGDWEWDITTNALSWSDEVYRIFGLRPHESEVTYEIFLSRVHRDDVESVKQSVEDALEERQPYSIDHRIILPDGSVRMVHEEAEVTRNKAGKPVRMAGTVHDITMLKEAEEELRALSRRLVQIQEEERREIARELHDQIGQSLTVLKLQIDKFVRTPGKANLPYLTQAQAVISELIAQIRNMSLNLRPAMLDDLGLLHTLLWYLERYTSQTQIRVTFQHSGLDKRLPTDISTAAYRVVQEALTNVTRHAQVNEVSVQAWADGRTLTVRISDQGAGFKPEDLPVGASSGLRGMRERMRLLGGKLTIESNPGAGTSITAEMPFG